MDHERYDGFGEKAIPFLKALGFHQSREWFNENKALFESELNRPRARLVDTLAIRLADDAIPLTCSSKTSTFRINRDVRFAKDKSPYNTHVSAVVTRTGTKNEPGLLYVHVKPDACFLAAGFYGLEGEEMRAFREAIVSRWQAYRDALEPLFSRGYAMERQDDLKRVPRGFETVTDPDIMAHLKHRHLTVARPFGHERLEGEALLEDMVDLAKAALPFLDFGWRIVDPLRALREAESR